MSYKIYFYYDNIIIYFQEKEKNTKSILIFIKQTLVFSSVNFMKMHYYGLFWPWGILISIFIFHLMLIKTKEKLWFKNTCNLKTLIVSSPPLKLPFTHDNYIHRFKLLTSVSICPVLYIIGRFRLIQSCTSKPES